ncbi:hypothetical protein OHT76_29925 [Streptomyces sp. NBC_00287]|uniref:aroma-sacti cluster domain-containing protein n=1 Tax=Streptomyces sp. NBC_00287 TaxID=2975702 RepID=UPI002E2B0428|nr:aroma-sacti cluster domain-containing protein [Streptomyces sp. NBC_00287]
MSEHQGQDPLDRLRRAGIPVDHMVDPQREVLASLTDEEIELLIALRQRLDEATPDVMAHSEWAGGVVW